MAVFDILLRALEEVSSDPFLLDSTGGRMYPVPEFGYVGDLISLTGSLLGLQDKADMVSAGSQLLGLTIDSPKLRVFRADCSTGSLSTTPDDGVLLAAARYKPASPLELVVESCFINKVAYRGALSGRSLQQTISLGKHLAAEYRRRTLNNMKYQEESLSSSRSQEGWASGCYPRSSRTTRKV